MIAYQIKEMNICCHSRVDESYSIMKHKWQSQRRDDTLAVQYGVKTCVFWIRHDGRVAPPPLDKQYAQAKVGSPRGS